MSRKRTLSNEVTAEHEQHSIDPEQQRDTVIKEKTRAAITAQEPPPPPPPVTNNQSSARPIPSPASQQPRPPKSRARNSKRMCRMFFPSSGRMGFDKVKNSDELPPIETLREMIMYETRLRLSEPIQELMDLYHIDEDSVTLIHDLIQQHVVEHFGYQHMNALRTALYRFPNDPVVKEVFYVKHNKVTQGLVNCGESVQDVDLFTMEGHPTTLFSHMSADQPLIVLAGSTS
ncbi:unnamed protein product [Rotaria sordida]|uniref:Uncharacterized protein n=1 Tax=Rotaria sordida TaxID=392033 RepID=A0A814J9E9_9BILA|nr:unnamed protein product [Rotaria sordida]CAF1034406.1 unnamed protein product [Rotaria sordida]